MIPRNVNHGSRRAAGRIHRSWIKLFGTALFLVMIATTVILSLFTDAKLHPGRLMMVKLPTHMLPMVALGIGAEHTLPNAPMPHSPTLALWSVRDIVAFPDEVLLLISTADRGEDRLLPSRHGVECLFGGKQRTEVLTIEWQNDLRTVLAARCKHPSEALSPADDAREATLIVKDSDFILPSTAEYVTNSSWTSLVYETVNLADSVLLFVKGLVDSKGKPMNFFQTLDKLSCRFGTEVHTPVLGIAQEVVRCEYPPRNVVEHLEGLPVSLSVPKKGIIPSVAYFQAIRNEAEITSRPSKMFDICSCTMIWNQARFLREWIMYHGFLGIERWYLYDNNSDDEIDEVLECLQREYNVSCHAWPWIKTQEAGFSHCALRARSDCEWVVFTDVDEFIYPVKDFENLAGSPAEGLGSSSTLSKRTKKSSSSDVEQVDISEPEILAWQHSSEKWEPNGLSWQHSVEKLGPHFKSTDKSSSSAGEQIELPVPEILFWQHSSENWGPNGLSWQHSSENSSPKVLSGQHLSRSFRDSNNTTVLRRLLARALQNGTARGKTIGEVRVKCHNFGPSGRVHAPDDGVIAGYVCRLLDPLRHKSFLLLDALSDSLQNAVHHFALREGYEWIELDVEEAVVNHYKFQAWEVFKVKFVRRVATYVVDWRKQTAETNDRAPGLGQVAVEPPDWPMRFCEELDLRLRDIVRKVFGHSRTRRMPWELN